MHFFETYFTSHHLIHAPHKWFLAFLSSPIHFAEMHYKKRYHLQFAHARKLFIFDILLFLTLLCTLAAGIFWRAYDPTVTDLVYITITPSSDRILSGDFVTYTIGYKNESEVVLKDSSLTVSLPQGFVTESVLPKELFKDPDTFSLGNLESQMTGEVSVSGRYYGTPNIETRITAALNYVQSHRAKEERKSRPFISILRGSSLESTFNIVPQIINNSWVPFSIKLKNTGDIPIEKISVPLYFFELVTLGALTPGIGKIDNNLWNIEALEPEQIGELTGTIKIQTRNLQNKVPLTVTPNIRVRETDLPQVPITKTVDIIYPHVAIQAVWESNTIVVQPNQTAQLFLTITNDGTAPLSDLKISIPLPASIINQPKFISLNNARLTQNNGLISGLPNLVTLNPGQSTTVNVYIPIAYAPQGGTDLSLSLAPQVTAHVSDFPESIYTATSESPRLSIGTQLIVNVNARYFTDEGDQLGRGPLPPTVGEETKYWVFIELQNLTSNINDIALSAHVPSHITWTGKTSVSLGADVNYNPATRVISWTHSPLSAHTTAGVYIELALTPTDTQRGQTPVLLENIIVSGTDTYIGTVITRSVSTIDSSLKNDAQAHTRGVVVQ